MSAPPTPHPAPPPLWVVLVSWNNRDDVLACLGALQRQTYPALRVALVDNGSADGTAPAVRAAFPAVEVFALPRNEGFAHAVNVALAHGLAHGAGYFLLLNADTSFEPDTLARLVAAAEARPQVGVLSPKVYLARDPRRTWAIGGILTRAGARNFGMEKLDDGRYDARPLDYVFGCAMLVRAGLLRQIGLLDERFFVYFEETDLCVRARAAGWLVALVPQVQIRHAGDSTTRGRFYLRHFYLARSRMLFLRKHRARFRMLPLLLCELYLFGQIVSGAVRLRAPGIALGFLGGAWAGLLGGESAWRRALR